MRSESAAGQTRNVKLYDSPVNDQYLGTECSGSGHESDNCSIPLLLYLSERSAMPNIKLARASISIDVSLNYIATLLKLSIYGIERFAVDSAGVEQVK